MIKIAYITCKDEKEAQKIGKVLIKEKLAACINIIPVIKSIYRWKGKVVEDSESVLLAKTDFDKVEELIKRAKELHSYELPGIEIINVTGGSMDYLKWIKREVKS